MTVSHVAYYATPKHLGQLQAVLSGRDLAIMHTLASYRLARGDQLRRWHFTGHASLEAQARAARRNLRRLADLGLISHLERRIGGIHAGSSGLVWHLTRLGRLLLARVNNHPPTGRIDQTEPSPRTLDHTLAITETAVRLQETTMANQCELIQLDPEPASWRTYLNPYGGTTTLKPDLFAITAALSGIFQDEPEYEDVWFIEIDRATESRATIIRKAEQYETYRHTGREQAAQDVFPRVAWIVPNETRADMIRETLAQNIRIEAGLHIAVTTDQFIRIVCGNPENSEPPP